MRLLHFLIILVTFLLLGCGREPGFLHAPKSAPEGGDAPANQFKAGGEAQPAPEQKPQSVARKIIYTAHVELVVEDFDAAQKTLLQLLEEYKGYVAKSEVRGSPGTRRSGTWTVRVPVANFRAFLAALDSLGEPQRSTTDSQDVTDEYYDLEARLKNKRVEEERLLDHLKKSTGKLEDILAVERELARVRGEIEQAQGRLQKLTKLTELTTVTVSLQERKDYVPAASPSFATTLGRTFTGSLDVLLTCGKGLLLAAVALVPWLPLLAVIAVPTWLFVRRSRSDRARRAQPVAEVVPAEPPQAGPG
ncbi:MAG TPA: DUF4349 domain-containing protein [Gemmataceae bacterium]|nr:DUF4349 domain-containing protein [Gemmataceae bacterium]